MPFEFTAEQRTQLQEGFMDPARCEHTVRHSGPGTPQYRAGLLLALLALLAPATINKQNGEAGKYESVPNAAAYYAAAHQGITSTEQATKHLSVVVKALKRAPGPRQEEAGEEEEEGGHQVQQPQQVAPQYYCDVCEVSFQSASSLDSHKGGAAHRKKASPAPAFHQRCEVCDVDFTRDADLEAHLAGNRHARRVWFSEMQRAEAAKAADSDRRRQCLDAYWQALSKKK
eukprot:TRINITY_DN67446_c0_g1_i1.p2 TRINITY_DN67446_c0_g1~~TRINITY_DN67446_c0_g1_i1.p2  ORF type:complete len:229 (+),score=67.44 TRINITY_DN67446_c0_g1_i1:83-769(+)